MRIITRPEQPVDLAAIFTVNRQAFGRVDEAQLVDALRAEGFTRLSLVAEFDRQIVGHILFSRLPITDGHQTVEALSLAPMAVLPQYQRQGVGSRLVDEGLRICAEAGHQIVVVLGHPEFYPRFGFSPKLAEPLQAPFSGAAWMAIELIPGALAGVAGKVEYLPPFGV